MDCNKIQPHDIIKGIFNYEASRLLKKRPNIQYLRVYDTKIYTRHTST